MIKQIRQRLTNNTVWYRLTVYALFLLTLLLMVFVVTQLDRGLHGDSLRLIALLAALFSLLLTLLRKPKPVLLILSSLVGSVFFAFTIIGNLLLPVARLLQIGASYLLKIMQYFFVPGRGKIVPDQSLLQQEWQIFAQDVSVLYERLLAWLAALPEPAYDPISLNLAWGMIIWLASIWFFWFTARKKQVFIGILPPVLIAASVYQSVNKGLGTLFFFTGIGILLAVLAHQALQEDFWQKKQYSSTDAIRKKVTQYSISISVGLVIFAGIISSPRLDDFIEDIRERRQQDTQSNAGTGGDDDNQAENSFFGPEEVLEDTSEGWLPNVHLIGSPPELAEIEVFRAQIEEPSSQYALNYYFRAATYETYTFKGWQTTGKDFVLIPPEEEFEIDFTPNESLVYQKVTFVEYSTRGNLMLAIGELAAADVPYYSAYHTKFVNNTYTDLFASVTRDNQYIAYSKIPYFGEEDLRSTTLDYPTWITNKFLQVPDSVPDRIYDLALDLTATQPTQYDRALAIERYLRGFEYSLEIETPPQSRDIVDYFLFDIQKGYCDYYASAMVILARAAGIPARLATGYIVSTYDPELDIFTATADQAHSWAELYFPEYGWVTFEPTAGRPALERQEEREILPDFEIALDPEAETPVLDAGSEQFSLIPNNFFMLAFQLMLAGGLVLLAVHYIDQWILASMEPHRLFARLYRRLRKRAKKFGIQIQGNDTPLEFTQSLAETFRRLNENDTFNQLFGSIPDTAEPIILACNRAAYSNQKSDEKEIKLLIAKWGRLRWQLMLARLFLRLKPITTRFQVIWYRFQQPA